MDKNDIIMILCGIVIIATNIYMWDKLYALTGLAWGLWGLAIFVGTIASANKQKGSAGK